MKGRLQLLTNTVLPVAMVTALLTLLLESLIIMLSHLAQSLPTPEKRGRPRVQWHHRLRQGIDAAVSRGIECLYRPWLQRPAKLATYPGVLDIQDDFRPGKMERQLALQPAGRVLGLTLADLAHQVRHGMFRAEAVHLQRGREAARVMNAPLKSLAPCGIEAQNPQRCGVGGNAQHVA
ncbi:hypothetical protein NKDENANG_03274 [Candidatus Entotheonellaceae bacterium PAL068K]